MFKVLRFKILSCLSLKLSYCSCVMQPQPFCSSVRDFSYWSIHLLCKFTRLPGEMEALVEVHVESPFFPLKYGYSGGWSYEPCFFIKIRYAQQLNFSTLYLLPCFSWSWLTISSQSFPDQSMFGCTGECCSFISVWPLLTALKSCWWLNNTLAPQENVQIFPSRIQVIHTFQVTVIVQPFLFANQTMSRYKISYLFWIHTQRRRYFTTKSRDWGKFGFVEQLMHRIVWFTSCFH